MDYLTLLIIVGVSFVCYMLYVSIIKKRNKANEALSNIDVQLTQRLDLIPNILKIAQKFIDHETTLLTEITTLRTKVQEKYNKNDSESITEHLSAAQELSGKMGQIMMSVENYPDLKSDKTMVQAMQTYNEVEAQLTAARRFYNASVTELNNAIQIFPGSVIAQLLNISEMPFFEADSKAKLAINVDDFLR